MPRKRILCTEDDPDSRDMLVLLLRNNGFEVWCATNGNDAREMTIDETYSIHQLIEHLFNLAMRMMTIRALVVSIVHYDH